MVRGYPDYYGGKSDISSRAEWSVKDGTYKEFEVNAGALIKRYYEILHYTVPTGKTLYITQYSLAAWSTYATDAELNQMVELIIYDDTLDEYRVNHGGNGGCGLALPEPLIFPQNHVMELSILNCSNHYMDARLVAIGYEV